MEVNDYLQNTRQGDYSDEAIRSFTQTLPWEQKKETRAAFYSSYDFSRMAVFEQAVRHPDLIELSTNKINFLRCWTPGCTSHGWDITKGLNVSEIEQQSKLYPTLDILKYSIDPPKHYIPGHYKYVIVPQGMAGMSTSSRLLYLLSYCECVVLLMGGHLQYHISARLVPWVHYVPLSPSGAEVATKVRWLQQHDALAKQIAENGHNFGKSYLRLEDYLCYAATTVQAVADVLQGTTALQPFSPVKISV